MGPAVSSQLSLFTQVAASCVLPNLPMGPGGFTRCSPAACRLPRASARLACSIYLQNSSKTPLPRCLQIGKDIRKFAKTVNLLCVCIYGGQGMGTQISDLKRGTEIVVCTPGRMIDILVTGQGKITNLKRVTYLVFDEADRMFDMGFEPQISRLHRNIRPDRQTVMFSATFPRSVSGRCSFGSMRRECLAGLAVHALSGACTAARPAGAKVSLSDAARHQLVRHLCSAYCYRWLCSSAQPSGILLPGLLLTLSQCACCRWRCWPAQP